MSPASPHASTRRWPLALLSLIATACSSTPSTGPLLHVPSPAWEEQVVYFVMTDRFANGDKTNDDQKKGEYDPTAAEKYSGGDLQGIIDKLDYIQGLGATAVWITPPVANMWWDPLQQSGGYHGYWARNLKTVDEHVGTLETYQKLSAALHARGMYLIQDIVPNHMGNFFTYSNYLSSDVTKGFVRNSAAVPTSKPEQAPFDQDDVLDPAQKAAAIYHWTPAINDYFDTNQELNYQVSDLDDLNSENPVVRTALRDSYGYWIKEVGVDAFRVDTAKYVPHDFWHDFFWSTEAAAPGINAVAKTTGRSNFLSFGEVFEEPAPLDEAADRKVASYLGTTAVPEMSTVLQYPLYSEIARVFTGGKPTSWMSYRLGRFMDPTIFPNPWATPTFLDNHDNQRFLASSTTPALLQALSFLFTIPGIPIVYYGTEQGFEGTRAAMFKGGYLSANDQYDTTTLLYKRIKALSDLRKSSKAFTHGTLDVLYDSAAGPGPLVYRRVAGNDTALVLLNTSDSPALISGLDSKLPAGTVLNVVSSLQQPPTPLVGNGGLVTTVLPPRAVVIAMATSQVVAPPAPTATITVATPIDGKTFTGDVTISGTASPASTALKMVLDSYLDKAADVTVAADGTWSTKLAVSAFATGKSSHTLSFYAPSANVASPTAKFQSEVVFVGQTLDVDDPAFDDKGRSGSYAYPRESTFKHQQDVTHVKIEAGVTTMNLHVTMADWSIVWKPPNGFDHVCFNVFFSFPGQAGQTVLPLLDASAPAALGGWNLQQFTSGWTSSAFTSAGASATSTGAPTTAPNLAVDAPGKTVTFTYDRTKYGLASWSGVKVYVTTWDYDGIGGAYRAIAPAGGQWTYGGGAATDPMIMDEVAPITIP